MENLVCETYFPTFIYFYDFSNSQELNPQFLSTIRAEREKDQQGLERSNFRRLGGWHSKDHFHTLPAFEKFTHKIHQVAAEISKQLTYDLDWELKISNMWAIINAPGSLNRAHIHPGHLWSGVYYVQAPPNSGSIEFTDPRTEHLMLTPNLATNQPRVRGVWKTVEFQPQPGRMLMFPSWLYHTVHPNMTEETGDKGERVCISFNLVQVKTSKKISKPQKSRSSPNRGFGDA
ncbi:TIGR02466 family protein [Acaryochloris sp. IP29b_bin.148]|uniref:TIGR02466 family protein n=1 Tax=Acaryochloris sp. IP29b_bin.148 TaxID=2969218 RepID=UPI00261D0F60|nr:TIGR02466 family protein [Acaryochloris sp. IP29b_bin.148]